MNTSYLSVCMLCMVVLLTASCSSSAKLACPKFPKGNVTTAATGKTHSPQHNLAKRFVRKTNIVVKKGHDLNAKTEPTYTPPPDNMFAGANVLSLQPSVTMLQPAITVNLPAHITVPSAPARPPSTPLRKSALKRGKLTDPLLFFPADSLPKKPTVKKPEPTADQIKEADKLAKIGATLSIVGWFLPYLGMLTVIGGLVLLGIAKRKGTSKKRLVKAAFIFNIVMLAIAVIASIVFFYWLIYGVFVW